ncbi:MAG: PDZ domain-containing protein, partial [Pseudomonadota bacterium]
VIRIEEGLARSMEGLEALEQDFEVAFAEQDGNFRFLSSGSAFSSMELVELSEGLGSYFGTDQGLLVVSAPSDEALGFVDGDVIKSIGGRIPKNVGHAMRILRSYSAGEDVKIEILRNRKKRTLDITVPERSGGLWKEKLMGRGGLPLIEWSGDSEVIIVDETEDSLL